MVLRVGTDCSGIECPIQALQNINIPFEHVWSSETDRWCIKNILANFNPKHLFGDVTQRDNSQLPGIDLYVAGFPCQPFSSCGKRKGFNDSRGHVFFACLDVIQRKQPKMFVLENVKGILTNDKGKTWEVVWGEIQKLEQYGYTVDWKILNTRDYGIPQNRPRIYIIGLKGKIISGAWLPRDIKWPNKCTMKSIKTFVDYSDKNRSNTSTKIETYISMHQNSTFLNMDFYGETKNTKTDYVNCIMKSNKIWCVPLHRWATTNELASLQGIHITNTVSKTQFKYQIGNAMSVNVLEKLMECNIIPKE
tara:strand:+ start:1362 stop:2279 length:918 start_codon:yes stop_codon:yes gene_type:complete